MNRRARPRPRSLRLKVGGTERVFDIDDPKLPDWIDKRALRAGGYPYDEKLPSDEYEETLEKLQIELVKLQAWMQKTGNRVLAIFEGRDAAGKGGTISAVRQYMNPRNARDVALTKPTETERGQWYYQRYVSQFPTAGELVTFDRSWYNRAGVEPVMGFCTPEQHEQFLKETPRFEKMIVREGIHFFKFWLDIGRETQLEAVPRPPPQPAEELEVLADRRRRHEQMGRLHRKARPDVRAHAYATTRHGSSCAATTSGARGWPSFAASCMRCPTPTAISTASASRTR